MQISSISTESLQNANKKIQYTTSPIAAEKKNSTEGYAPITKSLWGSDKNSSVNVNSQELHSLWGAAKNGFPSAAFISPNFAAGRASNNPVNFDKMEADTQSGFRLSTLEHALTCPDCGKPIMTKPIFAAIKEELNQADESTYLSVVKSHKEFLMPQEQKIVKHIEDVQKKNPDLTIKDVVSIEREVRLDKLEEQQYAILDKMEEIGEVLEYEDRSKIHGLIDTSSQIIFQRQNTFAFQRGKFVQLVSELELKTPGIKEKLLEEAAKLPNSMNNEDAWYVKYGGLDNKKQERTSRDIAERLLAPTYTNTDHVHPWNLGGLDAVSNFWLMHARCNIIKTDKPFEEWLNEDRDNRIGYIKQYLTDAQAEIDKSTDKKMHPKYDLYSAKLAKTIYNETNGEVDFTKDFPLPKGYDVPKPGKAPKDAKQQEENQEEVA